MFKRTQSIGTRLSNVIVVAVLGGVVASMSFFLINEFRQALLAEQSRLTGSAAAFAAAAAPSVRLGDERGILLALRGIRAIPEVSYVAASDSSGRVIAEIGMSAMLAGRDKSVMDTGVVGSLSAETVSVTSDIVDGGEVVGSLTLTSSISALRERYVTALASSLLLTALLVAATAIFARTRISRIIRPLNNLASEFADIGRQSDLTRRVKSERPDEVGVLADAFNDMFSQIERRDQELETYRENLEHTVEERTADLRVAKEEAETANAAKSDFLALMSHEIRTPMNGMMVMAEILASSPLEEKQKRYAEIIHRSGRGLLTIINDVLDFSKIEAGKLSLEAIQFSLDSVLEDTANLFAERAREKGLAIALDIDVALPERVTGDPTRLTQVLGNLVNNGLKFTEAGGVTLKVRVLEHIANENVRLQFSVSDTGIGIAPEKIGTIFEKFSQADQSITRRFGGTGLGLSISRRIVEAMDGTLWVESQVGQGSEFKFELSLPATASARTPSPWEGLRVLILADAVTTSALTAALEARRAVATSEVSASFDLALVHFAADRSGHIPLGVPVVSLRALGEPALAQPEAISQLSIPIGRADLESVARSFRTGQWQQPTDIPSDASKSAASAQTAKLRILMVDDDAINREVLREALSQLGHEAEQAPDGETAVTMASTATYDVIFMDASMPGMDGFAAAQAIRAGETNGCRSFIIALTAHIKGPDANRWREADMDAYLAKPFNLDQLASVLDGIEITSGEHSSVEPAPLVPLVSPETLSMFASLPGRSGASLAAKVFGLFITHAPDGFRNLETSVARQDNIQAMAHALKSMCLSAGAARAAALCGMIEDEIRERGKEPSASILADLKLVLNDTIEQMSVSMSYEMELSASASR